MDMQTIISIITAILTLLGVGISIGIHHNKISKNSRDIKDNKDLIAKHKDQYDNFAQKVNDKHDNFTERIYDKFDNFEKGINDKIDEITTLVIGTVKGQSPLSLTEKGKGLAEKIKADNLINRLYQSLEREIIETDGTLPNPYHMQIRSMRAIKSKIEYLLKVSEKESLETVAFEAGINVEDLYPILGIILRDKIMETHNIHIDKIDTHDLNNTS